MVSTFCVARVTQRDELKRLCMTDWRHGRSLVAGTDVFRNASAPPSITSKAAAANIGRRLLDGTSRWTVPKNAPAAGCVSTAGTRDLKLAMVPIPRVHAAAVTAQGSIAILPRRRSIRRRLRHAFPRHSRVPPRERPTVRDRDAEAPRGCGCDDSRCGGDERDNEKYRIHGITSA
jgi:hypothetical protein